MLPHCYQHVRSAFQVRVAPSLIAGGGKGLFAYHSTAAGRANGDIVFRAQDWITPIDGETVSNATLSHRYGTHNVPFGVAANAAIHGQPNKDALCKRSVASYANTRLGVANAHGIRKSVLAGTNCKIGMRADGLSWIRATKTIRHDAELLVYYGADYRYESGSTITMR